MISAERLPTLSGPRVVLRGLGPADVPALFAVFSDAEVMRYWSSPPLRDERAAAALLREIDEGLRTQTLFQWGVARRCDDVVIGTCTLCRFSLPSRRAELGYALARDQWGQGYMREALRALLDYSFGALALRRLEADVDPRNAASRRTLERLGFRQEGYLRERWVIEGEVQDAVLYGLLAREWEAQAGSAQS